MTVGEGNAPAPTGAASTSTPLLRMAGVEKRYGGVRALSGADLTIKEPGVVHTLVGVNGSGKSTLLGILAGNVSPDAGRIEIEGARCSFRSPVDAVRMGIAMVSQETAVAPDLSVAENILLGHRLAGNAVWVSPRKSKARAGAILEGLGLDYDPATLVGALRPDQRQMIEIARAVSMNARILILDEPTSSLTDDEVEGLFATVRELKAKGVSILFVSHRLDDLFAIADEVTVLRDGGTACEAPMSEMDADRLVGEMIGEQAAKLSRGRGGRRPPRDKEVTFSVEGLKAEGLLENVEFQVRAGEVVGLAGLAGSGRSELLEALFGIRHCEATIKIDGLPFSPKGPRASIGAGLGYLPPDRKTKALNLAMSVCDNLNAVHSLPQGRLSMPRKAVETEVARSAADAMRLKAPSLKAAVGTLSGGNQQKVALGRWLSVDMRMFLLDEPTRGVDVAAKWEIHDRLRELADSGKGLLVSSSENDELLELCDRILVLFRGRLVAELDVETASEAKLARLAGGHT